MRIFTVMAKPQGKARPRFASGRVYTPDKTRVYEALVRMEYSKLFGCLNPIPGTVSVDILAEFAKPKRGATDGPCPKKPDVDNVAKAILDALNGVAFEDDAKVTDLSVTKRWAAIDKVTVTLRGI